MIDQTLAALAEPTRRRVVEHLARAPARPSELAAALQISPAALSRHLKVLRREELVEDSRDPDDSRVRIYVLRPARLELLSRWLDGFWTDQLDALKTHVERE